MTIEIIKVVASLFVLYLGSEIALHNSEKLGAKLKLSPLVIGIVLIGMGTSLPELFVSHLASFKGAPEMALGNLVGSNIANLFIILGLTGILTPLHFKDKSILHQLKYHLALHVFWIAVVLYGEVGIPSLLALLGLFVFYMRKTFKMMKKETSVENAENDLAELSKKDKSYKNETWFLSIMIAFGFFLLYLGADLLVESGKTLCLMLGISQYIVSAIFLAFGTSFPELMTCLVAFFKKKDMDLILGNVLGSNVFNLAMIMGSLGVYQIPLTRTFTVECIVLLGSSLYLLILGKTIKTFHCSSGVLFMLMHCFMIYFWSNNF